METREQKSWIASPILVAGTCLFLTLFGSCARDQTAPPETEPIPAPGDIWVLTTLPFNGTVQDILTVGESTVFVGTWGGGLFRSADSGKTWSRIAADITDDVLCLAGTSDGAFLFGMENGMFRSEDGGDTWINVLQSSGGIPEDIFATPAGEVVAGVFYGGIYYSSDNGISWIRLSTKLDDRLLCVVISKLGYFFAGTNSGMLRSTDHGASWDSVDGLSGVRYLAVNPNGILFASTASGVHRSTDEGITWTIGDGLGPSPVSLVTGNDGTLFAGTSGQGVFMSIDEGTTWIPLQGGLDETSVRSIAVTHEGYVYVGTWLAGLFKSRFPIRVRD